MFGTANRRESKQGLKNGQKKRYGKRLAGNQYEKFEREKDEGEKVEGSSLFFFNLVYNMHAANIREIISFDRQ